MIYPMFAMVIFTVIIGIITLLARINSVKNQQVHIKDYKLMNAQRYPEFVQKTTRNFINQFETPVLFYAGCLCYLAMGISSEAGILFAWAFVLIRIIHAYIHITYNHLLHRLVSFLLGMLVIIALWVNLVLHIA